MNVNRVSGVVVAILVLAIAACSSSPKEDLIKSADAECRTISERFAGDLAYGETINGGSVPKIRDRVALLKKLHDHVRAMPSPETGQAELDDWLGKLDTYTTELDNLASQFENVRPGMDTLLFLQAAVVDEAAKAVGPAGKRFGFDDCAQTEGWEHLDS
jgi:hypothetical protein